MGAKDWEKLPYRRGCLYAFYLDNQLRKQTDGKQSLETILQELLVICSTSDTIKFDHPLFIKVLEPYLGKRATSDFNKYIERGDLIKWRSRTLPPGLKIEQSSGTMMYGLSKDHINKVVAYRDIPVLKKRKRFDRAALAKAIIE